MFFWFILLLVASFISIPFLLSSQVAFFGSLAVVITSFLAYKKRVLNRLNDKAYLASLKFNDEDDDLDENYSENFSLKDEKERLKKQKTSIKDMNLPTAFVPYRLLAYVSIFIGFLALQRQEMLDIAAFLIGLSLMPLGAIFFGLSQKFSLGLDNDE